jgi:hypothetical protein
MTDVSYDDGATWTPVPVAATGSGRVRAGWIIPAAAGRSLTLRVTACDAAGQTIKQSIDAVATITAS